MSTQHAYEVGKLPVWTFSDKIRKARDIAGLNQKAFAERVDLSPSSLAAYETGRATPRFRDVGQLAKRIQLATGIPAAWFLTDDDPNPRPLDYKAKHSARIIAFPRRISAGAVRASA